MDITTTPIDMLRSAVAGNIYAALRPYIDAEGLGYVFPAGLFYALWKAAPEVRTAQVPDVSFIAKDRLLPHQDIALPYPGAPDFAAEVVTVTETGIVSVEKARDYLKAGTEEVWVLYTSLKEVHQYQRATPKTITVYTGEDRIVSPLFANLGVTAASLFAFP